MGEHDFGFFGFFSLTEGCEGSRLKRKLGCSVLKLSQEDLQDSTPLKSFQCDFLTSPSSGNRFQLQKGQDTPDKAT